MPLRGVLQTRWLRGLNAAFGLFSQPPNSLPRISNLILTRRGALVTTPGSRIVSSYTNQGPLPWNPLTSGMWKEIIYYNPNDTISLPGGGTATGSQRAGYYGLREEAFPRLGGQLNGAGGIGLGTPTGTVVTVSGAVALPGTEFAVTAADGVGGETLLSSPVIATVGAGHGLELRFTRLPNAFGYNVYMLNAGVWQRLIPFGAGNNFGSITIPQNPSSQLPVWKPNTAYVTGDQVQTFPTTINGSFYVFTATNSATSTGLGPPDWVAFPLPGDITGPPVHWRNDGPVPPTLTFLLADIPPANLPAGNPQNVTSVLVGSTSPPSTDTTQALNLVKIPVDGTGWGYGPPPFPDNLVATLPADFLPNPGGGGSGQRGGGATASGGGGSAGTVNGGISGIASPIPQIIQFADRMFLALGNGIPPYESAGQPGPVTAPITNRFQATIPAWQAGIGYIVGDQVVPGAGDTRLFTATQGGISGTGGTSTTPGNPPIWPTVIDQTVADGQVIWKYTGNVVPPPPPLGAAHVEVYAGSLWVANTRPSFQQQFPSDGPSALWMSDANNPSSWNPLNTAQIARDDGTEIMGIKAFSIAEAGIPTTQQLIVFKNFTTYVINGVFGAADFAIQQAETDQGCLAPRTIQFVPGFGLMRLTHLGFSYFDGIRDILLSTDLHPYLFGDPDQPDIQPVDWAFAYFSKGAQVADPPMYICAVPVLGANSDLLGTLPNQFPITINPEPAGTPVSPPFPPGQYFFRVSLRGPLMETALTPEIGPITISVNSLVTISSQAPLPDGYTGWRVYWGANGPGSETQFQDTGPELYSPTGIQVILLYPGTTITGPPIGLSGTLTRIFCFDLTLKCWTIVDLPFSISVLKQFRIMGQVPVVFSGGFWDATVRRLFSNAPDWDGVPIDWSLQSTEVYNQGGDQRIFYRRLRIRGTGNGPISVTPNRDGFDDETLPAIFWALGGEQFMAEGAIMGEAVNCHATVRGQGQVLIDSLDFHVVPKPVGAGVVIS